MSRSAAVPRRIVIVGGGPAGFATARAYREAGGQGDVTLLAGEPRLPYDRPPLTKGYLRGESAAEELPLESAAWFAERRILVRHERALALDLAARTVATEGDALPYDACVLATGASAARLPVPGASDPGVLTLRAPEDAERLRAVAGPGVRVAVIGSGFIGCEAAISLRRRGADVVLVSDEESPQAARLGAEAAERIAGWLVEEGVELRLGAPVTEIAPDGGRWVVSLEGGGEERADVVVLGSGIMRNATLARDAGLELTDAGAIAVDAGLHASDPHVYAAGDVAAPLHPRVGRRVVVEHWGEALNQGRIVGQRLAGGDAVWDVAPGFWSQLGDRVLKQVAWGDGYDEARFVAGPDGAFTVWYGRGGIVVGVLAHERDEDYERGRELVENGASLP